MQIQSQKNNVSFTSTPIHTITLKKLTNGVENGTIKAVFSKLNPFDIKDIESIEKIKETWSDPEKLIHSFYRHFKEKKSDNEFFAIELDEKNGLSKTILGLLNTCFLPKDKMYHLLTINTKPNFIKGRKDKEIKGIGEIMLGEAIQQAKQKKVDSFNFISLADNFYDHTFEKAKLKFHKSENSYAHYIIESEDFDKYIEYCEKKYGNNFSATI